MADLYAGIVIMGLIAIALGALGYQLGRRWPRPRTVALLIAIIAFIFLFSAVLLDSVWMIRLLPVSNVIVVGNWALPAAGLVIGLTWHALPRPAWRRCLLIVPLAAVGLWRFWGPLTGSPPTDMERRWNGDVCLQSSFSTCGPAAAATLLHAAGIEADEAELAELCLTRDTGTTLHGLYRGLKLKTDGTPWRVEVVSSLDALAGCDTPVLINVGLPRNRAGIDPRYERDWGWVPGYLHSVVVFSFLPDEHVDIGDPAIGREQWHRDGVTTLWHGRGLRLVKR